MKIQHRNKNGNNDNTLRTWFSNLKYQKVVFCSAPKCVDNKKVENNYRSTFCDCFRAQTYIDYL